jgi:hypothetical protein
LPIGVNQVELASGAGDFDSATKPRLRTYDTKGGALALPALVETGFHQLSWQGTAARTTLIAVSLASERESDLRERPLPEASTARSRRRKPTRPALLDWSWALALAALVVLAVEVTLTTGRLRPSREGT